MTDRQPLAGGFVADAVRVGGTVHKNPPRDPGFVHALLTHFTARGWGGAPRFLGTADGRDVLSYLDGDVPWQPADYVRTAPALAAVARLVREFHDLTAGTDLAADQEVVCHNDLSPKNTVYRAGLPVALIDWDIAAPGRRVHDVAHVCWQYIGLGPAIPDPAEAAGLIAVVAGAYGPFADRPALVATILWWQHRCRTGILAAAEAGDPAMVRLRDSGAADRVGDAYEWTLRHRPALERAV
ncbi:phosphotransferase [Actinoplanes sp. NPDC024001]|uniref:phosphotransferase family protein n=1 Tax=Actinoplanes sp. NPDC024001 TaxID=3154598 RepID=UPI003400CE6B